MKSLLILVGALAVSLGSVQAQCKNCDCKEQCSPSCQCKHDKPAS